MTDQYDRITEAYRFLGDYSGTFGFLVDIKRKVETDGVLLTDKQIDAILRCKATDERRRSSRVPIEKVYEPGMYRDDEHDAIYHVKFGKTSKKAYAVRVVVVRQAERNEDGKIVRAGELSFDYAPGVLRNRELRRLTRDEARSFGADVGVCIRCGAVLTVEDSVDRMMGPVCFRKEFGS